MCELTMSKWSAQNNLTVSDSLKLFTNRNIVKEEKLEGVPFIGQGLDEKFKGVNDFNLKDVVLDDNIKKEMELRLFLLDEETKNKLRGRYYQFLDRVEDRFVLTDFVGKFICVKGELNNFKTEYKQYIRFCLRSIRSMSFPDQMINHMWIKCSLKNFERLGATVGTPYEVEGKVVKYVRFDKLTSTSFIDFGINPSRIVDLTTGQYINPF